MAAITQLNADVDANCQALAQRLDALDADVSAAGSAAHADAGAVKSSVDAVDTTLGNPLSVTFPSGGTGNAVSVTNWPADQQVHDPTASSTADGVGQALHGDLWVIVGAIVGSFLFAEFLRKVWP